MDLQLPQRNTTDTHSFNTEPAALTAWFNDLPLINTGKSLGLLSAVLQEINSLRLPPDTRLEVLERFASPVICVTDALKKDYLDKPLPLKGSNLVSATQTLELFNALATGYRILAEDLLPGKNRNKPQLVIAMHRAMRYLSEILLTSYRVYIQYPEGLWQTINKLYAQADEQNITRQIVSDNTLQAPVSSTIETIYKQLLLLSLACPYRLRQNEIHIVYNVLVEWADSSRLHRMDDKNTHGLFSIDLQSDAPPAYRDLNPAGSSHSHMRILDTNNMASRLREALATSQDSANRQAGTANSGIMQRLLLAWGVMPKRLFTRHLQNAPIKLVIGLNTIHQLATGPVTGEPKGHDNIRDSDYLQDPTFEATTAFSIDPFFSKGTAQTVAKDSNPLKGAYVADKMAPSRIESWKIADISAGGYCLLWDSEEVSRAQVGELVALFENDLFDSSNWQVGTIRRMKFTKERGLELGVQLLSPGARAVWVRLLKDGISTGDWMQGIVLPGIDAIKLQASLLLPSLPFRTGCTATLQDDGKTDTVKLTRQLENTGSFAQYHFASI
jgi:cyclic-di-GMP-binding protein